MNPTSPCNQILSIYRATDRVLRLFAEGGIVSCNSSTESIGTYISPSKKEHSYHSCLTGIGQMLYAGTNEYGIYTCNICNGVM